MAFIVSFALRAKGSLFGPARCCHEDDDTGAPAGTYARGECGLKNQGQTCFMNSALLCLSSVPALTEYFRSRRYEDDINEYSPLGMHGQLACAYGELIQKIWSGAHRSVKPRRLKTLIGQLAPEFGDGQQHDVMNLLEHVLKGLHEDLNKVKKKPSVEEKEADGRPDKEVAIEAWTDYLKRNDSIIVEQFHGQMKTTLVCSQCMNVSVQFDPFCFLSLPVLPQSDSEVTVNVVLAAVKKQRWMKYRLILSKKATVEILLAELAMIAEVHAENLILAEVSAAGKVCRFFELTEIVPSQSQYWRCEIVAYELQEVAMDDQPIIVVATQFHFPNAQFKNTTSTETDRRLRKTIGRPVIVRMPVAQLTVEAVYDVLLARLRPMFTDSADDDDSENNDWWRKKKEQGNSAAAAAEEDDTDNSVMDDQENSEERPPPLFFIETAGSKEGFNGHD